MGALSGLGLLARRQLRTSWGATATLGVVAFLAAGVLSTAPRAIATMHADQVTYETAAASGPARDVVSVAGAIPGEPPGGIYGYESPDVGGGVPAEPDWAPFLANLDTVRTETEDPLRSVMGAPHFHVTSAEPAYTEPVPSSQLAEAKVFLRSATDLAENSELLEGRWPGATPAPAFEVAVSRAVAETYGWELGGRYDNLGGSGIIALAERYPALVVTGIFEAGDPDTDYWLHHSLAARASVITDPNRGLLGTASVYISPAMITPVTLGIGQTRVWYPVDTDGVTAADVPLLLAQANGQSAQTFRVPAGPDDPVPMELRPSTRLSEILERLLAQRTGVDAIVAVLAVGPLGATVAVLALGARLVVDRRRSALALLRARGASGTQLRLLMGGEGLVVGLGSAVAGFAAGLALSAGLGLDAPVTVSQVAFALAAGLAPATALALATSPAGLRTARADLAPRSRSRVRWVLEVLVVASAALATWLLLSRGVVAGSGAGTGVDPLVAAAPLLISLALTLLAVRAYPWLALALERALAPRLDLVPFLGAARATRDPAGGPVPAVALVLAVAVAATSAVLYSTVSGGVVREAWRATGSDLRISGPIIDEPVAEQLAAIEGVEAVTAVADVGDAVLQGTASSPRTEVYSVDAAALALVQEDVTGAAPETLRELVRAPAGGADDALPVILTESAAGPGVAAGSTGITLATQEGEVPVRVVDVVDTLPGLPAGRALVLADTELLTASTGETSFARLSLVGLADDADRAAVTTEISQVLPSALVEDPDQEAATMLAAPVSGGLVIAFVLAVLLAGLLCAAAVVMTLMLAAPARARLLAVLQTLGLSPRQGRGLVGWEIGPWAVVALVVGAVLGVAVPSLVLAAVDVTALTGGVTQPAPEYDPLLLGAAAAGFVAVVLAAVGVAAALSRRGEVAAQLRMGSND
ncbi:putative ABC transport system permease protein [Promicromonospora umidemergens]|uniref:ABC3 transporter permease C-terminal domain-containing protein n=1 Tax=Promicromonospora umidemergens TaxID=629679 RepID=A0ABP8YAQ0_9MICO|nr:FtsX-like permease family protein [Promicromonospora umidemergens]MCP2284786.1 putative ABC transport system permease protein [Promicromonospora umidemergens]